MKGFLNPDANPHLKRTLEDLRLVLNNFISQSIFGFYKKVVSIRLQIKVTVPRKVGDLSLISSKLSAVNLMTPAKLIVVL